jgi:hypothetical protein
MTGGGAEKVVQLLIQQLIKGKESNIILILLENKIIMNFKLNLKNNPIGFALFYKDQINREVNFILKLKNLIRFLQCQLIMGTKK